MMYQAFPWTLYGNMYARTVPDHALNKAVADELDALRRYAGLTQAELADGSGLSLRSVQRYLDGTRAIRIDDLGAMARALGQDPMAVFAGAAGRMKSED